MKLTASLSIRTLTDHKMLLVIKSSSINDPLQSP